jgi:hypothetical protein
MFDPLPRGCAVRSFLERSDAFVVSYA